MATKTGLLVSRRLRPYWLAVIAFIVGLSFMGSSAAALTPDPIVTIRGHLDRLPVAAEDPAGYDRSMFGSGWATQNDGCDTRDHVLRVEALRGTPRDCEIRRGVWWSKYDAKRVRKSRKLDVDHMIPLAEAWASGARQWNANIREAFANDLDFANALVAVTASSNRSKGDRDPAEWLPRNPGNHCWYVQSWIEVKYKYNLSIDPAEKSALEGQLAKCTRSYVTPVRSSEIVDGTAQVIPDTSPNPVVTYTNCTEARAAGVTPIRQDAQPDLYAANQHMDRDDDGIACE